MECVEKQPTYWVRLNNGQHYGLLAAPAGHTRKFIKKKYLITVASPHPTPKNKQKKTKKKSCTGSTGRRQCFGVAPGNPVLTLQCSVLQERQSHKSWEEWPHGHFSFYCLQIATKVLQGPNTHSQPLSWITKIIPLKHIDTTHTTTYN